MVDYDFYANRFLGSAIAEDAFPALAAKAGAVLARLRRCCRVTGSEEAEAMAICAMAEAVYQHSRMGSVHSSRVGDVSVQYNRLENLNRDLYDRACIYLDIYRGL